MSSSFYKRISKFTAIFFVGLFTIAVFLFAINNAYAVTETLTSSGTWTAPAGVTSVTAEVWGGGGAGGGQSSTQDGGGGGGGGAYSKKNTIAVTPGNNYTVTVGAGGTGVASSCGNNGGDTSFVNTATVLAKGGIGGCPSPGTPPEGGLGGASASGVGDTKFSGGQGEKGRDASNGIGGYGGSSAGTAANGWSGPQTYSTNIYPTASTPTGAGHGGDGGAAANNGSAPVSGYGGGGGGSGDGTAKVGGAGYAGKIVLTYTPNTAPTLSISQPDGTSDTVIVGDLYNITYSLSDTEQTVTSAFYYDTNNSGLDGTAISGACATAPEGTNATCSWNTTGVTVGSYYVYGITNDGIASQVSAYSTGVITINAVPASGTVSASPSTCTISSGASTCTVPFTWSISNATSPNLYNSTTATQYSTSASGTGVSFAITNGSNTVQVRDSTTVLNSTTATGSCISGTSWNGTLCAETPAVPTVTTPTVTSITSSGATLGANVTSLGVPASISARGTCWGTSASPTTNCVAEGGTTTGVFSHSRTGLSPSTFYYYRGYATNSTGTGYSADDTFTTSAAPTTTLGTGTDPATATVEPGSAIRDAGAFTFVTSTGGDTVTGLTVTLAGSGTPYAGLSEARVTSDNGSTTYFTAVTSFSSNSVSFSGGTSIPVSSGTPVQFKIRLTPLSHASMPPPAGASYDLTPYVSSFTATNTKVTSDSNANTLTIDNLSPGASTSAGATPGDTQVTVSWTNPVDADFSNIVVLRDTATIGSGSTPSEGSSPTVGSSCGGTACQVRYISTGTSFIDTSLTNGTTYYYRIFAKDTRGNYTVYASTQQVSAMPTAAPVTTLADGTNPGNSTIAPGSGITDLDVFTLITNTGTDTVTAVTVSLSPASAFNNIAQVDITDDSNLIRCTSVVNPGSNSVAFSPCTSNGGISVTTSATTYKVRITPKSHANMPAVPGASYATTGTVSSFTNTNSQGGSDSTSATITVDNGSPANVSNAGGTAGNAQVSLNWTNPADSDYDSALVLRRTGSAVTDAPTEGDTYSSGGTIGSSYIVCVATASTTTCNDTSLTNGTAYHYKFFSKDSRGNYSAGVAPIGSPFTPSVTTFTITSSAGANGTIVPLGDTSVAQGSSQLYSITANTGYEVSTLTVDGSPVTPAVTSYTFTNVQAGHSISATFTQSATIISERLSSIIFVGKAFPGGEISVIQRKFASEIATKVKDIAGEDGTFRVEFTNLDDNVRNFGLLIKDPDGRTSQTKFFTISTIRGDEIFKNIIAPPTIDILSGQVTRGSNVKVFGYASPYHTIRVYIDDILAKEALAGRGGVYSFDIPTGILEFGQHKVRAKQIKFDIDAQSDFSTTRTFIVSRLAISKADLSGDDKIDIKDWSIFLGRFFSKNQEVKKSIDLNSDGKVDISDFSIFIRTFRKK